MRKVLTILAAFVVATVAEGATVVLRGGKQVNVASFEQKGNLIVLTYDNGRLESYPLAAVDMAATQAANRSAEASPPTVPTGPHSPFLDARAAPGSGAVMVTDADVKHLEAPEGEEKKAEAAEGPEAAQIALVSYDRKKIAEGEWEITATIVNQGSAPASGITANVRMLALDGSSLGTGAGSYPGQLAPKQQDTLTVKVSAVGEVGQVGFDFQWVSIQPVRPAEAPTPELTAPPAQAAPPAQGTAANRFGAVPPGSPPNVVPANPLGLAPVNELGTPPQLPLPSPVPATAPPA
jgi:hypothetical protein